MRGFVLGSLALIALYTVVTVRDGDAAGAVLTIPAQLLERALSPEVAGIPDAAERAARIRTAPATTPAPAGALNPTIALFQPGPPSTTPRSA